MLGRELEWCFRRKCSHTHNALQLGLTSQKLFFQATENARQRTRLHLFQLLTSALRAMPRPLRRNHRIRSHVDSPLPVTARADKLERADWNWHATLPLARQDEVKQQWNTKQWAGDGKQDRGQHLKPLADKASWHKQGCDKQQHSQCCPARITLSRLSLLSEHMPPFIKTDAV